MTRSTPRPHYCNSAAFELFAAQASNLGADGALLRGAIAIALHDDPSIDYREVEDQIDALADRVRNRVQGDNPRALTAHAHEVLFEEEGFTGNVDNYYDPANSYLPNVLATKRGIPIALTLIYKEVLDRIGVTVYGTNAPGHFLATVWLDEHPMMVDPFDGGRVLGYTEAYERLERIMGHVDRDRELLPTATNRGWLARMLQNLQVLFNQAHRQHDLAAMLELSNLLPKGPSSP